MGLEIIGKMFVGEVKGGDGDDAEAVGGAGVDDLVVDAFGDDAKFVGPEPVGRGDPGGGVVEFQLKGAVEDEVGLVVAEVVVGGGAADVEGEGDGGGVFAVLENLVDFAAGGRVVDDMIGGKLEDHV